MNESWIDAARQSLLDRQTVHGGWGYRPELLPLSEPTSLAAMALLATATEDSTSSPAVEAAEWLTSIQQPDGHVGLSAEVASPGWPTAYAILLWSVLDGYESASAAAVEWLVKLSGRTFERDAVTGHDPRIPGWPWVADTHSWLEPTAAAVLALRRQGLTSSPRTRDGIRLILDRATRAGGWNFGGVSVFGADLCPHPAPTGLALLALASLDEATATAARGCQYLLKTLPRVRSPRSLGWGLIGLDAWHQRPDEADLWLAESFHQVGTTDATAVELAELLLASTTRCLKLFREPSQVAVR